MSVRLTEPVPPVVPVRPVTASPRLHYNYDIHETHARETPDDRQRNLSYPERFREMTQGAPMILEILEQQCVFYDSLMAGMKAEQSALREDMRAERSAIRQDMSQGLAEIKRELQNQHASVSQAETSSRQKLELNLNEIEDRIARMELKSETSSEKVLDALQSIEVNLRKNVDLSSVLETTKANQASSRSTVDIQPQLNLPPVIEATDNAAMHRTIAKIENAVVQMAVSLASDVQKCRASFVDGIAIVHSKQDEVAAAVLKISNAIVKMAEPLASDLQKCRASFVDGLAIVNSKRDEVTVAVEKIENAVLKIENAVDEALKPSDAVTGRGALQEYIEYKKLMCMDWDLRFKRTIDGIIDHPRDTDYGETVHNSRPNYVPISPTAPIFVNEKYNRMRRQRR